MKQAIEMNRVTYGDKAKGGKVSWVCPEHGRCEREYFLMDEKKGGGEGFDEGAHCSS